MDYFAKISFNFLILLFFDVATITLSPSVIEVLPPAIISLSSLIIAATRTSFFSLKSGLLNSTPSFPKSFEALNYYTNENITIPLDPTLSASENAKKYFDKYMTKTADAAK